MAADVNASVPLWSIEQDVVGEERGDDKAYITKSVCMCVYEGEREEMRSFESLKQRETVEKDDKKNRGSSRTCGEAKWQKMTIWCHKKKVSWNNYTALLGLTMGFCRPTH